MNSLFYVINNFFFSVKPEFVRALRTDVHEKLDNGTVIKSIAEDETISLSCEAGGAKPIPNVQWWNGTSQIQGKKFFVLLFAYLHVLYPWLYTSPLSIPNVYKFYIEAFKTRFIHTK